MFVTCSHVADNYVCCAVTCSHAGNILNDDVFHDRSVLDDRPLQALAAGLKAYATWEAVSTLQACRECTGGMVSSRRECTGGMVSS